MLLQVKNLEVEAGGKLVLKGVNLELKKGEVLALLGPNASGKSSLAHTLMGLDKYRIKKGEIYFRNKEISKLKIETRVKLGMSLSWQHPPVVEGVKLGELLNRIGRNEIKRPFLSKSLLIRELNKGFSGGERKLAEILQIVRLRPKLVILDELDAGLDLDNLARVTKVVKEQLLAKGVGLILISHQGEIFRFLQPDMTKVMLRGEIVCSSKNWQEVWQTIKEFNYEKCRECKFLSS